MISDDLKQIYSDYDDTRMYYDTVQLYHPNFNPSVNNPYPNNTNFPTTTNYPSDVNYVDQSYFLVMDNVGHSFKLEDDSIFNFEPYPFRVIQPQVGEDQQDIGIVFDNVSLDIITGIESAAENPETPIQMTFRVYMDGADESQITPITLSLTEIVVDMFSVSCKASRVDLYARSFPFGDRTYFLSNFTGLIV